VSDGSDPYRRLSTNTGGTIAPALLPTDSLGPNGSWTVNVPIDVASTATKVPTSSDNDGIYGRLTAGALAIPASYVPSSQSIYQKKGQSVYAIDADLATAIFIRTGSAMQLP
jgi:hypothetical protein